MNLTDFCCGVLAGWSMVLVQQPLDYIKTVLQTTESRTATELRILKDIHKQHGLRGFYRGSSSMFFGFSLVGGV